MMAFYASTVHSKLVPKERNLEHRFSRSLGTEKRVPISLKRERESAKPEFARAMRNVSLNASASGGSHPTSVTTPTQTQAASPNSLLKNAPVEREMVPACLNNAKPAGSKRSFGSWPGNCPRRRPMASTGG